MAQDIDYRQLVWVGCGLLLACSDPPPEIETEAGSSSSSSDSTTTDSLDITTTAVATTDDSSSGPGLDSSGSETTAATDSGSSTGPGVTCREPMTLCGDDCVDTRTDVGHCGDCGELCPAVRNGTSMCMDSRCGLDCLEGFDDCDADIGTGCEADLANDPLNCGGCGLTGTESCNSLEDDCNGVIDDGCPGGVGLSVATFDGHDQYGNLSGGVAFDDSCPAGAAVHRIFGNIGGNVDRMQAECAALVLEVDDAVVPHTYAITAGMTTVLPVHGGNITTPFDLPCPADQFVVGIEGEASMGGLHDLTIHCAELLISGDIGAFVVAYGPVTTVSADGVNSGEAYSDILAAPQVMSAIRGRAGAWVDAIGLGESDVTLVLN